MQINDQVQVHELIKCIKILPDLKELNISYQGFLPKQLSEIMLAIAEHHPKIHILNLSGNPLPDCDPAAKVDNKHAVNFITNLLRLIENEDTNLLDLDLSGMNLKDRVEKLSWAIKQSKTLMSVHISSNHIPKHVLTDLLMVFGIRTDKYNIAGKEMGFMPYKK